MLTLFWDTRMQVLKPPWDVTRVGIYEVKANDQATNIPAKA